MPSPTGESSIIAPSPEDQALVLGYRITKWKTYPNYECVLCQYATLWLDKMKKHLAAGIHVWSYPQPQKPTPEPDQETTDLEY